MPVTTFPAGRRSEPIPRSNRVVETPHQLGHRTFLPSGYSGDQFLQSSFADDIPVDAYESREIKGSDNGFLFACIDAYFKHLHLEIRPDDVWLSILTQLNMYIRANAENLRSRFVAHKGKRELVVRIEGETGSKSRPLGFAEFAQQMTVTMQQNILDKDLREWVMPEFSTTTKCDRVVASIVFMGAMSKYFSYCAITGCGLPSVKLLGDKQDWEKILKRLDKIPSLGKEPTIWHGLLRPVIQRFVETFDYPSSSNTKAFWQKIVHHHSGGSGQPNHYSGWLTAFSFWNDDGDCLYHKDKYLKSRLQERLSIDGAVFHRVRTSQVAQGWVSVDVKVIDTANGHGTYMTTMFAGSLAMEMGSSGENGDALDRVSAMPGWFVYLKDKEKKNGGCKENDVGNAKPTANQTVTVREAFESMRTMWAEMEVN